PRPLLCCSVLAFEEAAVEEPVVAQPQRAFGARQSGSDEEADVEPGRQGDRRLEGPDAFGNRRDGGDLLSELRQSQEQGHDEHHDRRDTQRATEAWPGPLQPQPPALGGRRVRPQLTLPARVSHEVAAAQPERAGSHLDRAARNRERCRQRGDGVLEAVPVELRTYLTVGVAPQPHVHRPGALLAVIIRKPEMEERAGEGLPPAIPLQPAPVPWLDPPRRTIALPALPHGSEASKPPRTLSARLGRAAVAVRVRPPGPPLLGPHRSRRH